MGGQDELVFDGARVILDEQGDVLAARPSFEEDLIVADLDLESVFRARLRDPRRRDGIAWRGEDYGLLPVRRIELPRRAATAPARRRPRITPGIAPQLEGAHEVYEALVLGLARLRAQERLRARSCSACRAASTRRCAPPRRRRARARAA